MGVWTVVKWQGRTDVRVRFEVTDGDTGQAISQATVYLHYDPRFVGMDEEAQDLTMTTDENGHADHVFANRMCGGSKGWFEDTFSVSLPSCQFHAWAPGYLDSNPAFLDTLENRRMVQRGDQFESVSISVALQRAPP
jgi:hypothetical protein